MTRYRGILQKMMPKRKKGAILGFDSVNYLLVLIIFVGLGVVGLGALEGYRIVSCKMELNDIATAAATYQNLRIDHAALTDPGQLINSNIITAAEAVDGAAHGNFLKTTDRWKDGVLADPWGNNYTISDNHVISQGGINGQMSAQIDITNN